MSRRRLHSYSFDGEKKKKETAANTGIAREYESGIKEVSIIYRIYKTKTLESRRVYLVL